MNSILEQFAREYIIKGLTVCSDAERLFFNRMYSHTNLEADINTAVTNMSVENLDTAMLQVEATLRKRNQQIGPDERVVSLAKIADYADPHWKGSGLPLHSDWIIDRLAANLSDCEQEIDRLENDIEALQKQNKIWEYIKEHARCDEKHGNGISISANLLKSHLAFRYWCNTNELELILGNYIATREQHANTKIHNEQI